MAGDRAARRFLASRLIPAQREQPVQLDIAELRNAADAKAAYDTIAKAIGNGEMTTGQACQMRNFIEGFLHANEAEKKERPIDLERTYEEMFGIKRRSQK